MPPSQALLLLAFTCVIARPAYAFQSADSSLPPHSTSVEALRYIHEMGRLDSSASWPHVRPGIIPGESEDQYHDSAGPVPGQQY